MTKQGLEREEQATELKELVTKTLEAKGLLGRVQAELRAGVFLALEESNAFEIKNPFSNAKLKEFSETLDGKLVISLVREFLEYFNLEFTKLVFDPEIAGACGYKCGGRTETADGINLNPDASGPLLSQLLPVSSRENLSSLSVLRSSLSDSDISQCSNRSSGDDIINQELLKVRVQEMNKFQHNLQSKSVLILPNFNEQEESACISRMAKSGIANIEEEVNETVLDKRKDEESEGNNGATENRHNDYTIRINLYDKENNKNQAKENVSNFSKKRVNASKQKSDEKPEESISDNSDTKSPKEKCKKMESITTEKGESNESQKLDIQKSDERKDREGRLLSKSGRESRKNSEQGENDATDDKRKTTPFSHLHSRNITFMPPREEGIKPFRVDLSQLNHLLDFEPEGGESYEEYEELAVSSALSPGEKSIIDELNAVRSPSSSSSNQPSPRPPKETGRLFDIEEYLKNVSQYLGNTDAMSGPPPVCHEPDTKDKLSPISDDTILSPVSSISKDNVTYESTVNTENVSCDYQEEILSI